MKVQFDIADFVGASVTVDVPGFGEQSGTITAVSKIAQSGTITAVSKIPIPDGIDQIDEVMRSSTFLVTLDDGAAIETEGENFTQYHIVKEMKLVTDLSS